MSGLRWIYLGLAILGGILPMIHFLRWVGETGQGVAGLPAAFTANAATTGLAWDLVFAAAALCVFILSETLVRRDWWVLICIPATLVVGVGFGLPLYLFMRARPLR